MDGHMDIVTPRAHVGAKAKRFNYIQVTHQKISSNSDDNEDYRKYREEDRGNRVIHLFCSI